MKRYVAILIVTLLVGSSQGATAEESLIAPAPNTFGDLPTWEIPEGDAPPAGSVGQIPDPGKRAAGMDAAGMDAAGARELIQTPGLDTGDDGETPPFIPGDTVRMLEVCPAVTESSGSWLRRGYWYAELDLVVTNRMWNTDGLTLMEETTDIRRDTLGRLLTPVTNSMFIDDSDPGAQGLPRLTLGKFLFRDASNRDHSAEVTWFGGGEWTQQGSLDWTGGYVQTRSSLADIPPITQFFGIQSPPNIDGSSPENVAPDPIPDAIPVGVGNQFVNSGFVELTRNPSFDFATATNYRYDSNMDSIELNYSVKERMQGDRMILKPSGQWVRQAKPTRTLGFSAGVRYLNFREALNWNATLPTLQPGSGMIPVGVSVDPNGNVTGVPSELRNGRYFVSTDNNLIGTQLGFTASHETSRWSIGIDAKGGAYWNATDLNSFFTLPEDRFDVDSPLVTTTTNVDDNTLSLVAETSILGKWHLTPNWSLRAGLEIMWIEGAALAPHQLNFFPGGYPVVVDTGNSIFMGTSMGVESYW